MSAESADLLRDGEVSSSRCSERTVPLCVSALVLLIVGIGILCALAAGPLHAQCAVEWYVNTIHIKEPIICLRVKYVFDWIRVF